MPCSSFLLAQTPTLTQTLIRLLRSSRPNAHTRPIRPTPPPNIPLRLPILAAGPSYGTLAGLRTPQDLPWDEMLDQHTPGLQHRTAERPTIVIAALPRADSPSAEDYLREQQGRTMWTKAPQETPAPRDELLATPHP